jgi:hypothetical protein
LVIRVLLDIDIEISVREFAARSLGPGESSAYGEFDARWKLIVAGTTTRALKMGN